ncbi:two-component system, OmpR family, sensor kinase [Modicisalibacter ilicicola DSM 19980]|uniref:histidine kinase n=1 Tax=Modicisalibacter ilicicola DSM 19980 TaxID=1121942 RepID=A0A1M4SHM4_9GAMM|nr:ATP-binding protein [Halomonas ilicicola]SHE31497.1 two-component system, OmpR family, sensor kinase [Halomonas ilicicola DSM 19980]
MSQPVSLQRRLGIGLTLGVAALWLVATTLTVFIVQHTIDRTLDSSLEETAQRILSLAVVEIFNRESSDLLQQVASLRPHEEYITYLVRGANGIPLLISHDVDLSVFPETPQMGLRSTATHRLYGTSAVSDTFFIEVAEPLTYRHRATREMLAMLLLPLAVLVPLSLAGIWWLVRHSLGGLLAYRQALEERDAGDLSPVEAPRLPAELVPVAVAVDQLLARLRRVLEAERSFTANSAHELRTPLAAALAQVQRLRREAPPGPLQDRAWRIEASLRELSRLSEKLMQLAKAESGGLLVETPQDVLPVVIHVVDDFRRSYDTRLELSLPKEKQIVSSIDPDALAILLRNLIENALKHGREDRPVEVAVSSEGVLRVINAGPVVPAEDLVRLTDRFTRANSRADGSGLGLAIAQAIATGSGATLTLISPATGRGDGFEASLWLPP